jgi:hypothetical protein
MTRTNENEGETTVPGGEEKSSTTVRLSNAELVEKAIQAFAKNVNTKNVTVAEFIRLLELQKQMGQDEPKEIRASWIESRQTSTDR